jgi:hypothetical protein
MKAPNRHDVLIGVTHARREHDPAYADALADLYTVTLNHAIAIEIVPAVDRQRQWPPALPDDVDRPASPDEARRIAIRLARYAVTPDAQRAGSVERLPAEADGGVIFFVDPAEFDALVAECAALERGFTGIHDATPLSALGASCLAEFLRERFLPSGQLTAYELGLLDRAAATP